MKNTNLFIRVLLEQEIKNQYGTVNKFCSETGAFKQPDLHKFLNSEKDYRLEKLVKLLSILKIDIQFLFHADTTKYRFPTFSASPRVVDESSYIQKDITID